MKNLFGLISSYSVVICPPPDIVTTVAVLKNRLAELIGWYESKNSAAHISIISFETDEYGIETLKEFLKRFASLQFSFTVTFNDTGSFGKAFCLAPEESSNTKLISLMKQFHHTSPKFPAARYYEPHISIGRNLTAEQVQIASTHIERVKMKFVGDNISLRKFNPDTRRFELEAKYIFNA